MKRGLLVSDLHVGSIFGMLPPHFEASDQHIVLQNPGQKYLWECWNDLIDRVSLKTFDFVAVVGDVIDGSQPKQHGTELCLPLLEDQAEAAYEVLNPLFAALHYCPAYFIQGTEYHDGLAGQMADRVADKFASTVQFGGIGTGRYSHEVLDLEVEPGIIINLSHGIGTGVGLYRTTALDREGIFSALAGKEGKVPKADVVVRAHCHFFLRIEHASKHLIILPCWELQTRNMRKNSVYRMIPDLGAVELVLDGNAKSRGEDPCEVKKYLYRLPERKTAKLLASDLNPPKTSGSKWIPPSAPFESNSACFESNIEQIQ